MSEITVDELAAQAKAFLDANAGLKTEAKAFVWGEGPDDAALFEEVDREKEKVELARAKEWRAKRYDAGFAWITGPEKLGGRGLTRLHERAYNELEARYDVPDQGFFGIGLGMVAPTIQDHATPEVAAEVLPKMYRGDIVGCQLFSEPGAGSENRKPGSTRPSKVASAPPVASGLETAIASAATSVCASPSFRLPSGIY